MDVNKSMNSARRAIASGLGPAQTSKQFRWRLVPFQGDKKSPRRYTK